MSNYSAEDLVSVIRLLRRENIYGMTSDGKAGLKPTILFAEVSQHVSVEEIIKLVSELRANGKIMVVAVKGPNSHTRSYGSLCVVECSLDEKFFLGNEPWHVAEREIHLHTIRIYIVEDGFPISIARRKVVKRALSRLS